MRNQRAIVTPAPGSVFLRIGQAVVEMTPGEAVRLKGELSRAIGIAIAVQDGSGLLRTIQAWRATARRRA